MVEKETLNRLFFSAPLKEEKAFFVSKSTDARAPKRHAHTHTHTERESSRALVVFGQHERLFFESSTFFTREKQLFKRVFG